MASGMCSKAVANAQSPRARPFLLASSYWCAVMRARAQRGWTTHRGRQRSQVKYRETYTVYDGDSLQRRNVQDSRPLECASTSA
jgi:hypothetical protein